MTEMMVDLLAGNRFDKWMMEFCTPGPPNDMSERPGWVSGELTTDRQPETPPSPDPTLRFSPIPPLPQFTDREPKVRRGQTEGHETCGDKQQADHRAYPWPKPIQDHAQKQRGQEVDRRSNDKPGACAVAGSKFGNGWGESTHARWRTPQGSVIITHILEMTDSDSPGPPSEDRSCVALMAAHPNTMPPARKFWFEMPCGARVNWIHLVKGAG